MKRTGCCCRLPAEQADTRLDFFLPAALLRNLQRRLCEIHKGLPHRQVSNISARFTPTARSTSSGRRWRRGSEGRREFETQTGEIRGQTQRSA